MPRMNLEGSSSIVTGGASGIGEACARQLSAAGSKVLIADLNEERGQQIADEIGGAFIKCDVTSTEDATPRLMQVCGTERTLTTAQVDGSYYPSAASTSPRSYRIRRSGSASVSCAAATAANAADDPPRSG